MDSGGLPGGIWYPAGISVHHFQRPSFSHVSLEAMHILPRVWHENTKKAIVWYVWTVSVSVRHKDWQDMLAVTSSLDTSCLFLRIYMIGELSLVNYVENGTQTSQPNSVGVREPSWVISVEVVYPLNRASGKRTRPQVVIAESMTSHWFCWNIPVFYASWTILRHTE